jgi:hypothetical protein
MVDKPTMGEVRNAVRRATRETSYRRVGLLIGLGPSSLHKFLSGATPYPKNARKLRAWYARQVDPEAPLPVEHAIELVLAHVRPDRRQLAREQIRSIVHAEGAAE